jgi:hypothetical protein
MFTSVTYTQGGLSAIEWSAPSTVFGSCPSGFSVVPSSGTFVSTTGTYAITVVLSNVVASGNAGGNWGPTITPAISSPYWEQYPAPSNGQVYSAQTIFMTTAFQLSSGTSDVVILSGTNCKYTNIGTLLSVIVVQTA